MSHQLNDFDDFGAVDIVEPAVSETSLSESHLLEAVDSSSTSLVVQLTRDNLDFLAQRGFLEAKETDRLWEAMVELYSNTQLSLRQGKERVTCKSVGLYFGIGLVMMGLLALGLALMWNNLLAGGYTVWVILFCGLEALGWLLLKKSQGKEMAASVCFTAALGLVLPLIFFFAVAHTNAFKIYAEVWGVIVFLIAPTAAHFYFTRTPLLSAVLYLDAYLLMAGLMIVVAMNGVHDVRLGALPVLLVGAASLAAGIVFDSKIKYIDYAFWAHVSAGLGLLDAYLWIAIPTAFYYGLRMSSGWIALVVVSPILCAIFLLCSWTLARRMYALLAGVVLLAWLIIFASRFDIAVSSIYVAAGGFVLIGLIVTLCTLAFVKYSSNVERFLHARLPSWMFTANSRRQREYATIGEQAATTVQ